MRFQVEFDRKRIHFEGFIQTVRLSDQKDGKCLMVLISNEKNGDQARLFLDREALDMLKGQIDHYDAQITT